MSGQRGERFMAPGPWITRDLKPCVLAADFDAAVTIVRELMAYADGMNPVPPVIARARLFLFSVDGA